MSPIPEIKTQSELEYSNGWGDLSAFFKIAKTESESPHEPIDKPVSISYLYHEKILETSPSGMKTIVYRGLLDEAGPATQLGLENKKKKYLEWGFDVEMIKVGKEWVIKATPEGSTPIYLDRGSDKFNDRGESNAIISPESSAALVGLFMLSPKDDPSIYEKARNCGLVLAHLWENIEMDVLVLPGKLAKKVKLLGEKADDRRLYAFSRVNELIERNKEPIKRLVHPVPVITH